MILVLIAEELLGRNRPIEYYFMMDDDECDDVDWIHQVPDRNQWNTSINTAMTLLLTR
jgi:hypothetical protein